MDISKPTLIILLESGSIYEPTDILSGTVFFIAPTSDALPYGDTLFLDYLCEDEYKQKTYPSNMEVISEALKLTLQTFNDSERQSWKNGGTYAYPFNLKLSNKIPQSYHFDQNDGIYTLTHSLIAYFDYYSCQSDPRSKTDTGLQTFTKIQFKVNSTRSQKIKPDLTNTILEFPVFEKKEASCLTTKTKNQNPVGRFTIEYPKVIDPSKGMDLQITTLNNDKEFLQDLPYMTFVVNFQMRTKFNSTFQNVDVIKIDLEKTKRTEAKHIKEWNINVASDKIPQDGSIYVSKDGSGRGSRFLAECRIIFQVISNNPAKNNYVQSNSSVCEVKFTSPYVEKTGEPEYSLPPPENFAKLQPIENTPQFVRNRQSQEPVVIGNDLEDIVKYK